MATQDKCCTIVPYFKVSDGKLQAFRALCEEFVAKTQNEPKCLYYGFSFMETKSIVGKATRTRRASWPILTT